MPRFVLLHHVCPEGIPRPTHWDFLLEEENSLRSWALACPPAPNEAVAAIALPAHRLKYLDYEGPVSKQRGTVSRWDQGTYRLIRKSESELRLEIHGLKISGLVVLSRDETQRWTLMWSSM